MFGANRAAKTGTIIVEAIWFAIGKHPYRGEIHGDGWIVSLDFGLSKTIAEQKFFEWCPAEEIKHWSEKYQTCEMKSGNTVTFKSADSGRKKFQSKGLRWACLDEEIDKGVFEEIQSRHLANDDLDIWIGCTPLEGMTYLYADYYEPWEDYHKELQIKLQKGVA